MEVIKAVYLMILQVLSLFCTTARQSNLCTTVTLDKWQGVRYIQGDHYIRVNLVENI